MNLEIVHFTMYIIKDSTQWNGETRIFHGEVSPEGQWKTGQSEAKTAEHFYKMFYESELVSV